MRKVYVTIELQTVIELDDELALDDVIDELDYELVSMTEGAEVLDTEIIDYFIEDSK